MSIIETVERQVRNLLGMDIWLDENATHRAICRVKKTIKSIVKFSDNPYFDSSDPAKNVLFLWILSNEHKDTPIAKQLYYLNKILHGCDLPPEADIPEMVFIPYTFGVVITGEADLEECCVIYPGVDNFLLDADERFNIGQDKVIK